MQLKIQRSQRTGGVLGKTVFFALDVRADYSRTEQDNISKYKLGSAVIYNSAAARKHLDKANARNDGTVTGGLKSLASVAMAAMNLNITMDSLGKGQHIECKDLFELIEAEDTIMEACKNIKQNLALAETFDGRTVLIDFDDDGEQVHRSHGMPDLTRHAPAQLAAPALPAPEPIVLEQPRPVATPQPAMRPVAHEPMQPMRSVPESDHVPLFERLDEEGKAKLMKVGLAAGAALVLYLIFHAL